MSLRIDSVLGTATSMLCMQERVSILSCFLAAWAALMMRLSGQNAVVLGQPYSVQLEYTELRDVIGCFATPGERAQPSANQPSPTHTASADAPRKCCFCQRVERGKVERSEAELEALGPLVGPWPQAR